MEDVLDEGIVMETQEPTQTIQQSQSLTTLRQETNEEHQTQTRTRTQPLLPTTTTDGTKRNQKQSEQPKKRQRKRSTAMKPRKSATGRTGSERNRCIFFQQRKELNRQGIELVVLFAEKLFVDCILLFLIFSVTITCYST